jgi:putative membrane protein
MYGDHGGWWGIGPFPMLLFWVVVIVAVVVLVKWLADRPGNAPHGNSARDILKERYARGEIDKEEFEQKRRDLEE